tara:strand:- start:305 stop:775 length:471 start_codon:yes stop_codon:yes gene_type:complete
MIKVIPTLFGPAEIKVDWKQFEIDMHRKVVDEGKCPNAVRQCTTTGFVLDGKGKIPDIWIPEKLHIISCKLQDCGGTAYQKISHEFMDLQELSEQDGEIYEGLTSTILLLNYDGFDFSKEVPSLQRRYDRFMKGKNAKSTVEFVLYDNDNPLGFLK